MRAAFSFFSAPRSSRATGSSSCSRRPHFSRPVDDHFRRGRIRRHLTHSPIDHLQVGLPHGERLQLRNILDRPDDRQLLHRPGQSNVQDPDLLLQPLPLVLARDDLLEQRLPRPVQLQIHLRKRHSEILVHCRRFAVRRSDDLLACARKDDHGELQPFALVDRHDPHHILALADQTGLTHLLVRPPHSLHVGQEPVQPHVAGLLISSGFHKQQPQIGRPLPAGWQTAAVIVISCFVQKPAHQLIQRQRPRDLLPEGDLVQHPADLLPDSLVAALLRVPPY